ncbi:MAG: class III signal peptide-containing protein [Euryarchaeota archaeon]|nr:class III signal peptide-containing protein [Euryarchaeota archaeon]
MNFLKDEMGQGSAEYILIFGGVIVLSILSLLIYRQYIQNFNPINAAQDLENVRNNVASP